MCQTCHFPLNYNILRYNPERHIDYDSGMGILDLVDEYDRVERMYFEGSASEKEEDLLRAYELAQPDGVRDSLPFQVPYRHLVNVTQMSDCFDGVLQVLQRTEDMDGIMVEDLKLLEHRVECVRYWLNAFAPEMVKFSLAEEMPDVELTDQERGFLEVVRGSLENEEWEGDAIHNAVYEAAKGAGAKRLVVTHISPRYLYKDLPLFEEEAKSVFPNSQVARDGTIIEIPGEE